MASITTTSKDLVLCGHGSYHGGAENTQLPPGIELWIIQPVGSCILVPMAQDLIRKTPITHLALTSKAAATDLSTCAPTIPYIIQGGQLAPNLRLHPLGEQKSAILNAQSDSSPHLIVVEQTTTLEDLLQRKDVVALIQLEKPKLRIFWAGCTASPNITDNSDPIVRHNELARQAVGSSIQPL